MATFGPFSSHPQILLHFGQLCFIRGLSGKLKRYIEWRHFDRALTKTFMPIDLTIIQIFLNGTACCAWNKCSVRPCPSFKILLGCIDFQSLKFIFCKIPDFITVYDNSQNMMVQGISGPDKKEKNKAVYKQLVYLPG